MYKPTLKPNKLVFTFLIIVVIILVISMMWYLPRAPNSDAEGFIVSIEVSMELTPQIYYVDDNGMGYYILLSLDGNITHDVWHWTNSTFQIGDKTFYYDSTSEYSVHIAEIMNVINKTKFHEHDWEFWNPAKMTGYAIEDVKIVQLNATYSNLLNDTIKKSNFGRYKHSYKTFFHGTGGGVFEMTIPQYSKSVIAESGTAPKGFEDIHLVVKRLFFPNYPYYSP